ncbi:MAG: type II toxin-antitoxin system VapC family toxin [Spirochaetaceae bacterium]|nr:MAG: type II toxin-antitoxin system VapC family toxin [Spirochaetaceae bacterium]
MNLLLDTHALLWMLSDPGQLSESAKKALTAAENNLHFSIASYWEIAIKVSLGKLTLSAEWQRTVPAEVTRNGIQWLPIAPRHIDTLASLPWIHRDPFDRLLISQAKTDHLGIVTRDPEFSAYGVETVW